VCDSSTFVLAVYTFVILSYLVTDHTEILKRDLSLQFTSSKFQITFIYLLLISL